MNNKEREVERQKKCIEIVDSLAVIYDTDLSKIDDIVAREIYNIVLRLEVILPNK